MPDVPELVEGCPKKSQGMGQLQWTIIQTIRVKSKLSFHPVVPLVAANCQKVSMFITDLQAEKFTVWSVVKKITGNSFHRQPTKKWWTAQGILTAVINPKGLFAPFFGRLKALCKAFHKPFRMNKTDLRIRPIFHRLYNRIEAHICICFTAYSIMLELERLLKAKKSGISLKRAQEITHNMYQIIYELPNSKGQTSWPLAH